ncbi:hypothetical protein EV643_111216 [Kribbella sp. VKM Ac-2527]|uniref:Uncharacterized protein n=1 Tax=Kribbella caucasensis TaxID=2512215 RepID=A0A4R6K9K3_9ACTN|nr:hypothetical protein [Kribbella sp. VKM Ac-2527]TDO46363.1 hypothetical protein EV643_111216 [Kribbella sp. VKM Ac-2527]
MLMTGKDALPQRMYRTLPADVAAVVRAYPPMLVAFGAALAGTALVFDIFYLVASPGLLLAAVYSVPVLAGLIAGLVAAADDTGLGGRVLTWTIAAVVALGITNIVVVAMISAMRRTDPSNWGAGGQSVLLAACTIPVVAVTIVVVRNLIGALGIELRTKWPHRKPQPPPIALRAVAVGKPVASKEAAARAKPVRVVEEPEEQFEPVATFVPTPPRVVDLEEPREVESTSGGTGHADRRLGRASRAPVVPPSRRTHRPGKRPGR